jgi:hypothetical protein
MGREREHGHEAQASARVRRAASVTPSLFLLAFLHDAPEFLRLFCCSCYKLLIHFLLGCTVGLLWRFVPAFPSSSTCSEPFLLGSEIIHSISRDPWSQSTPPHVLPVAPLPRTSGSGRRQSPHTHDAFVSLDSSVVVSSFPFTRPSRQPSL